jgi:hypothetical protein
VGEDVQLVPFDGRHHGGTHPLSASTMNALGSPGAPSPAGRFRSESARRVLTKDGHSTETPIPKGASSARSVSEMPTTAYLVAV